MPKQQRQSHRPRLPPPIHVRLQGDDNEYVRIKPPLPSNPYDLSSLLKVETAPRVKWRDVALAYFREGMWSAGITVLEEATSDDVDSLLHATDDLRDGKRPKCTRLDLLAALAGAHIMAAEKEDDAPRRKEKLRKAADVFSRADKIDLDDPSIWAARGWAEFHAGKSSAASWFDNAKDKTFVLGAMGLAAMQLNRGRGDGKRDVVGLLVAALRSNLCPGGVWTGLGYALFKESKLKAARNVARRALLAVGSVKEERLEALYLLALVESEKGGGNVEFMLAALREAYAECGGDRDARILSLIAEFHFNAGDLKTAVRFGKRAVEMSDRGIGSSIGGMFAGIQTSTKISALFQSARAQHHLGNEEEALQGFEEIKKMAESSEPVPAKINIGAFLRLGLLKLASGRKDDEAMAQECLEKVLKDSNEKCGIAQRALGVLLGRKVILGLKKSRARGGESFHKAVSLLEKGLAENAEAKKDVAAQLVYAGLVEENFPEVSLQAHREVVKTLEEENKVIDAEIWNNMSSLLARLGQVTEAREIASKIDTSYANDCKAVEYNQGRLAELAGDLEKAEAVFRGIPKGHPHYFEAITRIAVIAMDDENRADEAESLLKEALESSSTRCIAVALLSRLYARQKKFKQAQEILEAHRHEGDYLALSFSSFMHRFLNSLDPERRARFLLHHIGTPLNNILRRNKRNSFAANGVGVYFAESKMMPEAREVFTQAGVGPFTTKTAKVNLAHTQVQIGHRAISDSAKVTGRASSHAFSTARALFEQADKLYRDALDVSSLQGDKSEFNSYCELLLYIAWAQFEARDYREAADMLIKLLHLVPTSAVVWFNLGQALLESAALRVERGTAVLEEMQMAKDEFEGSRQALQKCQAMNRDQADPITRSQLDKKHVYYMDKYVRQQAKSHEVKLRNALLAEEEREEKRRESQKVLEERRKKQEQFKRKVEEVRLKKEEELRLAFEASKKNMERYNEEHERNMKAEEEFYEEDDVENGGDKKSTPKKPRKRKKKESVPFDGERSAKKGKKQKKVVKKDINDSGSEYSDVQEDDGGESVGNGKENGKRIHSNDSGAEGGERQPKRKKRSVNDDDDDPDAAF